MPFEQMDQQQVAAYLKMDMRQVVKLSSRGQIPCRKVGGKFIFLKAEVDHWVEEQMPDLDKTRLAEIEEGVSEHHGYDVDSLRICSMIPDEGIAVPLGAKTREATIRRLVDVADAAGVVYVRDELLDAIRARENLCSTALGPGVAMPHPRHPLPYDIARSFVVVGMTPNGIPFGAEDGSLTRLFFLICCKDESTHLHVLARLCRMLHGREAIDSLLDCDDAEGLQTQLRALEKVVLET